MADSRGGNNGVNDAVLSSIVDLVVQEDAQFVLFAGDLVNGSSNAGTLASQLDHWRDIMAPVYSSDMYGAKVFAGPGNHEIRNSASEGVWQSVFSDLPSNGPSGETYMTYSFDYLNAHFVVLNTNRAGSPHTVNYGWLANDLAATTADHIFVFGHEPAFPVGPHLGSSLDVYPDQRDAFWQLLVDYDVDIYFSGHEHLYNHIEVEGVHQVITGTCGAPIYSGYDGDFYHYALITVDELGVSVNVFDDNSEMRDSFQFGQPDCSDGIDNDGDGRIDFDPVTVADPGDQTTPPSGTGDPGCLVPAWRTESPDCQDGIDNDGDGKIDYDGGLAALGQVAAEPDPYCARSPWWHMEKHFCGLGVELTLPLLPLMWLYGRRRRLRSPGLSWRENPSTTSENHDRKSPKRADQSRTYPSRPQSRAGSS
jgi:predicted phosphodiesterase